MFQVLRKGLAIQMAGYAIMILCDIACMSIQETTTQIIAGVFTVYIINAAGTLGLGINVMALFHEKKAEPMIPGYLMEPKLRFAALREKWGWNSG